MLRALVILCLLTSAARAESWYEGEHGTNRIVHLSIATVGGVGYLATYWALERDAAPDTCRWCEPTSIDRATRNALNWGDRSNIGSRMADIGAYALTPVLSLGLVALGAESHSSAQLIDDLTPIVESGVIAAWLTRGLKVAVGRQRPYAHFIGARSGEDNLSFPSGHTSLAFALATSAGMVAHARGYKSEPYIWALGLTVASASGYFRIAGDKHYLTDVLAGAALGSLVGLTVPLLMKRNAPAVTAASQGLAVSGVW